MPDRPYSSLRIDELEELYLKKFPDIEILTALLFELRHRKTARAGVLTADIQSELKDLKTAKTGKSEGAGTGSKAVKEIQRAIPSVNLGNPSDWAKRQRTVIEYDAASSVLVDAGPGSGKTEVACKRVADLVNKGIAAPQILLISFTRAAIKELRSRIESYVGKASDVAGLNIFTLDSFTWQMLRGLSDEVSTELLKSYQMNIEMFHNMLKNPNADLRNFLDELEHIIVDESQDLIGVRSDLVIRLMQNLSHCGFTVFADPAQSIYGFTSEDEDHNYGRVQTLVDRILDGEVEGFSFKGLEGNYRTDDPRLRQLFAGVRKELIGRDDSDKENWSSLRDNIMAMSHGKIEAVGSQDFSSEIETLVLYRTRGEVLRDSSFLWDRGISHKIRMSGLPERIHPWIGRVFSEYPEDSISESGFHELWNKQINDGFSDETEKNPETAWQLLVDNAWVKGRVHVRRLREILARSRPPVDFIVDERTLPGPVLGTIHSSKGREADEVRLMLPPESYIDDRFSSSEIAEEERVLFVGATRARKKLLCGEGSRTYLSQISSSKRGYRLTQKKNAYQVEIGRRDDISFDRIVSAECLEVEDAVEIQEFLWENRSKILPVFSQFDDGENELWGETEDEDDVIYLGDFSAKLKKDLWTVADKMAERKGCPKTIPAGKINYLRMTGVTTRIIPPDVRETVCSPYRESGFMLAPVICGFPAVFFNQPRTADAG